MKGGVWVLSCCLFAYRSLLEIVGDVFLRSVSTTKVTIHIFQTATVKAIRTTVEEFFALWFVAVQSGEHPQMQLPLANNKKYPVSGLRAGRLRATRRHYLVCFLFI